MKNAEFSECKFSVDIVAYMYGELSTTEVSAFETHLSDCGECTDEFAEVANARYEVYDWKRIEFDPLPTPAFEIPLAETGASWIEKLRAAFTHGWAAPAAAFAGLAVVSILAGLVLLPGNDPDLAVVDEAVAPIESPTPVKEVVPAPVVEDTGEDVVKGAVREVTRTKAAPAIRRPQKRANRTPRPLTVPQMETRATTTENLNVPRLNDFTEEEDTSLRLAELFDDIETSD